MLAIIGRRELIAALAATATTWPIASSAENQPERPPQPQPMPVIGVVQIEKRAARSPLDDAFSQGSMRTGYVENQNVAIEWRWTDGRYEHLQGILAELVDRHVVAIAVPGAAATALAAKAATLTIPIVFMIGFDPVELGLVTSLAHPGGNLTGVAMLRAPVIGKQVDLLHQLVPTAATIALLTNPANPLSQRERRDVEAAVRTLGLELIVGNARDEAELDTAFPDLSARGARAMIIGAEAFYIQQSSQIAALAARYAIPAVALWSEYPKAGGLMSYGSNIPDAYRLAGEYVGRILKGEKPADRPVQQPTKFGLVINLKTAKALGLTVPVKLIAIADDVIE